MKRKILKKTLFLLFFSISMHSHHIMAMVNPSEILASATWDTIKIWNTKTGECLHTISPDRGSIRSIALNPHDPTIVAYTTNTPSSTTLKIYNWKESKEVKNIKIGKRQERFEIKTVAFDPHNPDMIAVGGLRCLDYFNWKKQTEILNRWGDSNHEYKSIAFDPQKRNTIAFMSRTLKPTYKGQRRVFKDKTLEVFNVKTGKRKYTIPIEQTDDIFNFNPLKKDRIATAGEDEITIWNLNRKYKTIKQPAQWISFNSDSNSPNILASGKKKIITIFEENKLMKIHTCNENASTGCFSPYNSDVLAVAENNIIKLYNWRQNWTAQTLERHEKNITLLTFVPKALAIAEEEEEEGEETPRPRPRKKTRQELEKELNLLHKEFKLAPRDKKQEINRKMQEIIMQL